MVKKINYITHHYIKNGKKTAFIISDGYRFVMSLNQFENFCVKNFGNEFKIGSFGNLIIIHHNENAVVFYDRHTRFVDTILNPKKLGIDYDDNEINISIAKAKKIVGTSYEYIVKVSNDENFNRISCKKYMFIALRQYYESNKLTVTYHESRKSIIDNKYSNIIEVKRIKFENENNLSNSDLYDKFNNSVMAFKFETDGGKLNGGKTIVIHVENQPKNHFIIKRSVLYNTSGLNFHWKEFIHNEVYSFNVVEDIIKKYQSKFLKQPNSTITKLV